MTVEPSFGRAPRICGAPAALKCVGRSGRKRRSTAARVVDDPARPDEPGNADRAAERRCPLRCRAARTRSPRPDGHHGAGEHRRPLLLRCGDGRAPEQRRSHRPAVDRQRRDDGRALPAGTGRRSARRPDRDRQPHRVHRLVQPHAGRIRARGHRPRSRLAGGPADLPTDGVARHRRRPRRRGRQRPRPPRHQHDDQCTGVPRDRVRPPSPQPTRRRGVLAVEHGPAGGARHRSVELQRSRR